MKMNPVKYQIARARSGLSTTDIVNQYGMRRATVCRAARGEECLPETIGRIARALGVDVMELIDTQEDKAWTATKN